jgi:hypothetical protein
MTKFNIFKSAPEGNISNSTVASQDKEKGTIAAASHHKRPASSRRSSYESAVQGNGVVLAKNERYSHDHGRPASVNATFEDGVVMESGFRGYLVVFGGFLVNNPPPRFSQKKKSDIRLPSLAPVSLHLHLVPSFPQPQF